MKRIFGLVIASEKEWDKELQNVAENCRAEHVRERLDLASANVALKEKVAILSERQRDWVSIDPFIGDVEPKDTEKRKLYVATVAGVYKDLLAPKWKKMIAELFKLLESSENDREFDQAIKGAIYAKREDILWGEKMVNEHVANMADEPKK